ncbi:Rha family transcriptional regulator [Azotobacter chroococcum]|uniref:Rha family transcriptional regulator n=1 Tax=Azotobacter chroococcum TaxID=353 RepID=UPI0010AE8EB7|nr:Rha family transcriptional regulator [Azotobacter chroococcum]TKD47331.1 hypothetical protein FCG41_00125 [Azotobacter chroococcum]
MNNAITLVQSNGEARVDSRLLAKQLGNQHESTMKTLKAYEADFREFGILRFEIGEIKGRGQPEQYALLNEDQCYLLLTYSRNTAKVRALKVNLVKAFREARDRTSVTDAHYLPLYHAMHEEVAALAKRAQECGSRTPESLFHINANKALNAALGIAGGERGALTLEQRLLLTTLQAVYRRALHESLGSGYDHREAGRKAKEAIRTFMGSAGGLLAGGLAA